MCFLSLQSGHTCFIPPQDPMGLAWQSPGQGRGKVHSCLEQHKYLLNIYCYHCYHNPFSWAPKQNQGFWPTVPNTVIGIERKMGKASWTVINVFHKFLSAAHSSQCCATYLHDNLRSNVLPPDSSAPLSHMGRVESKPCMEEVNMEITWCCRWIWVRD